jgi:hypothetical protein
MPATSLPEWYDDGPLVDVVSRAGADGIGMEDIVDIVHAQRYDGESRRRVERIVESTLDRTEGRRAVPRTTQARQSDELPPEPPLRWLRESDVEYLSSREFGRLLQISLKRFGGTVEQQQTASTRPKSAESGSAPQCLTWEREGTVVGVVAFSKAGAQVEVEDVKRLQRELESLSIGVDQQALVTNGLPTEGARTAAEEASIRLCDRRHLAGILELTRLTPAVYGDTLERGESPTFEWGEVLEQLPAPPMDLSGIDPFDPDATGRDRRGRLEISRIGEEDEEEESGSNGSVETLSG